MDILEELFTETLIQNDAYWLNFEENPTIIFDKEYDLFICHSNYRKLRDKKGRKFQNTNEVFNELAILIYNFNRKLVDGDSYRLAHAYRVMNKSQVGRCDKTGNYAWQKQSHQEKEGILKFAYLQFEKHNGFKYKKKVKKEDLKIKYNDNHPLRDPLLLYNVQKVLEKRVVHERENRLICFLIISSMYLIETPLSTAGLGPSSVGKSMVYLELLSHFPEIIDDFTIEGPGWIRANNITKAGLLRLSSEFVDHKIFFLGELPDNPTKDQEEIDTLIRQLQSDKSISRIIADPVNNPLNLDDSETHQPKMFNIKANIGIIAMSAINIEIQLGNRTIKLSYDESAEQTKRIYDFQAREDEYPFDPDVLERKNPSQFILKIVKSLPFRHYEMYDFHNPYAFVVSDIFKKLFADQIQGRRMSKFVHQFIQTITRINWLNREIVKDKRVLTGKRLIASGEDNLIGLELLWHSIEQSLFDTKIGDKQYYLLIKKALQDKSIKLLNNGEYDIGEWWSVPRAHSAIGGGKSRLYDACRQLKEINFLNSKPLGKRGWKYQIIENPSQPDKKRRSDFLPFFYDVDSVRWLRCYRSAKFPVSDRRYTICNTRLFELLFPSSSMLFDLYNTSRNENDNASYIVYVSFLKFGRCITFEKNGTLFDLIEIEKPDEPIMSDSKKKLNLRELMEYSTGSEYKKLLNFIKLHSSPLTNDSGLLKDVIIETFNHDKIETVSDETFTEIFQLMLHRGEIYEPRPGYYRYLRD